MNPITQYNAKDCTITLDGITLTGLGEDMISFEKDVELFTTGVGAQGDVVVNVINNDLCTLTIILQATSPQKDTLMNYARDRKEFPVWVVNKSIKERFGGTRAMIESYPELSHGLEAEDREFVIKVFDGTIEGLSE